MLGHVQHAMIVRAQFYAVPLPVSRRLRPEVHHYIKNSSSSALDQLCLKRRLVLEVHATQRSLSYAESRVCLHGHEVNPILGKFPKAPSTQEVPTMVLAQLRVDQHCAQNIGSSVSTRVPLPIADCARLAESA